MQYTVKHCAIVVLAAGRSSRLGSPKQLLNYQGKSLLQHAVEVALETTMRPVIVVTGYDKYVVKKELEGMNVEVVENERWKEGMSLSLHSGVAAAEKISADVDGIIFMVCDQPHINKSLLESLLSKQQKKAMPIVASSYNNTLGTPALFHKSFFNELMELRGDAGAGKLIKQHKDLVATVAFPKGIVDIDTKKDYEDLLQQKTIA
ncbi:nucleotidyltransferase family protein [Ginsengibacter hankyongi]|uniref:Nucleotidyltransferase family protein n=1 Tax=Ginsengibacter hankyongi TaxID=2607284 RepID=A0A5J5IDR1_9BACT|nr:nucleotidyltransferase family protein [Ginsengibacter hankyongi]KAA9036517.1 nucleotidyltransferase family protein [Ginsengibacter hankyongi]